MREGIHPEYYQAKVVCNCGNEFVTGSTKEEIHVEICSNATLSIQVNKRQQLLAVVLISLTESMVLRIINACLRLRSCRSQSFIK